MKIFLFLVVVFVGIWVYFPEPKNATFCYFGSGFYNWNSRVCSHVTENFCKNYLDGEFSGCDSCIDDEILRVRSCADECKANCQTESYINKL